MTVVPAPLPAPGASGNVLTSDGAWWASAAPSGGGTVSAAGWRCKTGTSYALPSLGITNNTALVSGALYLIPFVPLAADTAFDRIGIDVSTAAASTTIRLAIYELTSGWPGALTLDAGTVDSSTTGQKEITIAQTLLASKQYVLAALPLGGTPSTRTYGTSNQPQFQVPMNYTDHVTTTAFNGWRLTGQASAPSSASAASLVSATAMAFVRLRAA